MDIWRPAVGINGMRKRVRDRFSRPPPIQDHTKKCGLYQKGRERGEAKDRRNAYEHP